MQTTFDDFGVIILSYIGKKAIIWGDSVAKGVVWDAERGRYALAKPPAAEIVAEQTGIDVINHARMGMTVSDGLNVVRRDLERGVQADIAVIEFGGNDCDFDWAQISAAPDEVHLPRTPANLFVDKLGEIVSLAQGAGMRPILLTLPPINADKYFEFISRDGLSQANILHWLGDKNHIYRFHERYSCMIGRVAQKFGCKLVDIRSAFLDEWNAMSMVCRDGIHPTPDGQRLIGSAIMASL